MLDAHRVCGWILKLLSEGTGLLILGIVYKCRYEDGHYNTLSMGYPLPSENQYSIHILKLV